jgi:hypothetical protein
MSANQKTEFLGDAQAKSIDTVSLKVGRRGTTGWLDFTPSVVSSSSTPLALGGTVTATGKYQVVGKTMDVSVFINSSAAGTAGGTGAYQFTLPPGFAIKINAGVLGSGWVRANAVIAPVYVGIGMTSVGGVSDTTFRLVSFVSEPNTVGVGVTVSDTVYDAASTNGVSYNFVARFELA